MNKTYRIIKYADEYFQQYATLFQETWKKEPYGEVFTLEEIKEQVPKNIEHLFLCVDSVKNSVIGFVGGRAADQCDFFGNKTNLAINRCFYIAELGVDNEYMGQGLGEYLTNYLIDEALKSNYTEFILRTHNSKDNPAKKLYEKLGFAKMIMTDKTVYGIETKQARIDDRPEVDFRPYYYRNYPTLLDLKNTFHEIKVSSCNGINGVMKFSSGKPGPILGITMQTHGDEPAGLAVLWNFVNQNLQSKLLCGEVIFVLQNVKAAERYFDLLGDEKRRECRISEGGINFNRLPENALEKKDNIYETNRLQEIYAIYKEFQYGYDIHTSEDEIPMIITGDKFYPYLVKGFPIEIVLTNIAKVQIGLPSFSFFGGLESNIPVFEIEAGTDEDQRAFKMAIDCSIALMKNLKMLEGQNRSLVTEFKEYFICASVVLPNESFQLVKTFEYYERIAEGQELAKGVVDKDEKIIASSTDGHTIFPPLNKLKKDNFSLSEETMFISKPVKSLPV